MNRVQIKPDNLSIARVEEKCINCGMCLTTCKNNNNLDDDCINCGQCILTCPSGALIPKFDYKKVLNYINDTDYTVVAFTSPAVRVAIGDEFGYEPGSFLEGKMVAALKKIGFDFVFDTTFGADLTILEEANELIERKKKNKLPLFTSCCPSWVLYMEKYHKKDLELVSSCKSPIAMQAMMIKSYFADMYNLDKDKIIAVSITPCVSKKTERSFYPETDISITTREFAMMIRESNIDFKALEDEAFDPLLGRGSSAGLIFGTSGGVMEAALRTAYYMINKKKAPKNFYNLDFVRGEQDFKEAEVDMEEFTLKIAVVNKISTAGEIYEKLKNYDFVEVMTCPGGCVGGAGQPLVAINNMKEIREKRTNGLYEDDKKANVKESFLNPELQDAYISYLSKQNVELHKKKTLQEVSK